MNKLSVVLALGFALAPALAAAEDQDFCTKITQNHEIDDNTELTGAGCKKVGDKWVTAGGAADNPGEGAAPSSEPTAPTTPAPPPDDVYRKRFELYEKIYAEDSSLIWGGNHKVFGEVPGWANAQGKKACAQAIRGAVRRRGARGTPAMQVAACQDIEDQFNRVSSLDFANNLLIADFEKETNAKCPTVKRATCAWMTGRLDGGSSPGDKGLRGPRSLFDQAFTNASECDLSVKETSVVNALCNPK